MLRDQLADSMPINLPLKQELDEDFPQFLEELGMRIVDQQYLPQSFGNSFLILESPTLRVRFVRDRGQTWADVSSIAPGAEWWHVAYVLEAIYGTAPQIQYDLATAVGLLKRNFLGLVEPLGPKLSHTTREINRHRSERLKALRRSAYKSDR